jgi:amino acid adenylation domain-containing protein
LSLAFYMTMWNPIAADAESVNPKSQIESSNAQGIDTVAQRVAKIAHATPRAVALRSGSQQLSYGELDARANELAGYLRSLGVGREVVVGVALDRCFERIIGSLAIWRAGGAYLPLDPAWPEERLRNLLDDAQAPVVLGHDTSVNRLASAARIGVALDADRSALSQFAARVTLEENSGDDLAYVIYTSGSTGEPKGVEVTHGNLNNLIAWHHAAFDVSAADAASHVAGLGFDASVWEIWPYLAIGASLALANDEIRTAPKALHAWLQEQSISVAFVPTQLTEILMAMEWPADGKLRFMLTGGDTLHAFAGPTLPFTVVNNYGPTECTVVATSGRVPTYAETGEPPTIGKAIANTTIHLLDEQGTPVADGWPGEICVGGPSVARGYRGRPEQTAERFVADPFSDVPGARLYRTGDLGCVLPNGELSFRGRVDNQLKIRGYRIEPDGIAAALSHHEQIASCAVVARDNAQGEKQLVAYIVAGGDHSPSAEDLRGFLGASLPEYMIPAAFVGLSALPLTGNGKLDKAQLPEPTAENTLGQSNFRAPTTPTEQKLAAIVSEVLGGGEIGADDNFFLVGGHSLLGTQVVIRARDAFGVELTLWHLFEAQTVANLAETIETLLLAKLEIMSDEEAQRLLGT